MTDEPTSSSDMQVRRAPCRFNDGSGRVFAPVAFGDGNGAVYGVAVGGLNGHGYPDIATARSDVPNVMFFSVK